MQWFGLLLTFTVKSAPSTTKHSSPLSRGLFLCTEPDEAFFCPAVFKLGSDPVETASNFTAIVCVFVTVEGFEEEHPLISAEVNGFSGR